MEKGGHIYILGSTTGTLYIGVTSAIYDRVLQHRNGIHSGFAHKYHCNRLLYVEPFPTIDEAIAREKQLKGWTRTKKLTLIRTANPEFKDIAHLWGWRMIHRDESIHEIDSQRNPSKSPVGTPPNPSSS
jgi:putative endonuclease